jgi:hypothetical protein
MKEALAALPATDTSKPATGFALPAKPNAAAIITRN